MAIGSISFEQEPANTADKVPVITNWNPMIGYMLFQDDISSLFYFRLILEVRLDDASGTLLAKIKQKRNGYSPDNNGATQRARAFFDLRDIVNSQLVDTVFDQNQTGIPFQTIHKIGVNVVAKPFSVNGDNRTDATQVQTIFVKAYQQYSDSATAIPEEETTPTVNDTLIYIPASLPLLTARDTDSDYIQGTAFQAYQAGAATDLFLSDVKDGSGDYNISGRVNYIQDTDYHTVAFLNDFGNFQSDIDNIIVKYYDSSNSIIGSLAILQQSSSNGG